MREKFLGIWPIWKLALERESRIGFLLMVAGIVAALLAPLYFATNQFMDSRGVTVWDPMTSLDAAIPFIAWSVLFYHSLYFLFYPLPLYAMPGTTRARTEMILCGQGLMVLCVVSCTFFVLLPAEVHIRSEAIDGIAANPGWYNGFFEWLWKFDSPFNAWPSLHVSQAGLITLFAIRWWQDKPVLQWSIGILWVMMTISILTTKQHFLWDLVTALILLSIVWKWQIQLGLTKLDALNADELAS